MICHGSNLRFNPSLFPPLIFPPKYKIAANDDTAGLIWSQTGFGHSFHNRFIRSHSMYGLRIVSTISQISQISEQYALFKGIIPCFLDTISASSYKKWIPTKDKNILQSKSIILEIQRLLFPERRPFGPFLEP